MADEIEWSETAQYGRICGLAADQVVFATAKRGELWEPYIVVLFERLIRAGSLALDVGANIGLHSIAMVARRPDVGGVISFEPHPEIFPCLVANATRHPKIAPKQLALGKASGASDMRFLHRTDNPGGARVFTSGHGDHPISVITLDSLNLRNVSLMKVDVEGGELDVIDGALLTIQRERPALLVEIIPQAALVRDLPDSALTRERKIDRICALGYRAEALTLHDVLFTPV